MRSCMPIRIAESTPIPDTLPFELQLQALKQQLSMKNLVIQTQCEEILESTSWREKKRLMKAQKEVRQDAAEITKELILLEEEYETGESSFSQ